MLHRKHDEFPEPGLVYRPCLLDACENQILSAARKPLHLLVPEKIVKGISHWSKEKWNSLWNATKASCWKQSQQRIDIWSIVTERLRARLNFICWRVNNTILNTQCILFSRVMDPLYIKLKMAISFRAVYDWYLLRITASIKQRRKEIYKF